MFPVTKKPLIAGKIQGDNLNIRYYLPKSLTKPVTVYNASFATWSEILKKRRLSK
jgi:hypothetical protein